MMLTLVEQWIQSGLSQSEFSKTQNIKIVKLRYWIRKSRQLENPVSDFVQLAGQQSSGISIRYPNGVELLLPVFAPAQYIKSLINI